MLFGWQKKIERKNEAEDLVQ